MKCENCGYTHGWGWYDKDNYVEHTGEHGDFYQLPIKLKQKTPWRDDQEADVYGCPSCSMVFFQ